MLKIDPLLPKFSEERIYYSNRNLTKTKIGIWTGWLPPGQRFCLAFFTLGSTETAQRSELLLCSQNGFVRLFKFLFCMYVLVSGLHVYMCTVWMPGALGNQSVRKASEFWKQVLRQGRELNWWGTQFVLIFPIFPVFPPWISCKVPSCPNCATVNLKAKTSFFLTTLSYSSLIPTT